MSIVEQVRARVGGVGAQLDELADATAESRDRTVDFVRALAIVIVIVWHWSLSLTHWSDGELIMPNPLGDFPLGWVPTWLLQVMPAFFFVGGFANLATWQSVRHSGGGALAFYRRRLRRLLPPVLVFCALWAVFEAIAFMAVPEYPGIFGWAAIVFIPLWFLAAYGWVILLAPVTALAHERAPIATVAALGLAVALADVLRFGFEVEAAQWVNTGLVWIFVHQVGYLYRDGRLAGRSRWRPVAVAAAGLLGLIAIAAAEPLPRSLVAVEDAEFSHMWPTTVAIAALGVLRPVSSWRCAPGCRRGCPGVRCGRRSSR